LVTVIAHVDWFGRVGSPRPDRSTWALAVEGQLLMSTVVVKPASAAIGDTPARHTEDTTGDTDGANHARRDWIPYIADRASQINDADA
jgi:hypothetical protein